MIEKEAEPFTLISINFTTKTAEYGSQFAELLRLHVANISLTYDTTSSDELFATDLHMFVDTFGLSDTLSNIDYLLYNSVEGYNELYNNLYSDSTVSILMKDDFDPEESNEIIYELLRRVQVLSGLITSMETQINSQTHVINTLNTNQTALLKRFDAHIVHMNDIVNIQGMKNLLINVAERVNADMLEDLTYVRPH